MRTQMLLGVLISIALAGISFLLCGLLGNLLIERSVYSSTLVQQVEQRKAEELQEYIRSEKITGESIGRLNLWCNRGDQIHLAIYQSGQLLFVNDPNVPPGTDNSYVEEDLSRHYEIILADENPVEAFLYYYAGDAYYYAMLVICALISCAIFAVSIIAMVSRKVNYIRQLRRELDILAGGDLTYPVSVKGRDELSELAEGIDTMRESVLLHQEREKKARKANSELVTAMSHDLRTPLTALVGYLELLIHGKIAEASAHADFLHRSYDKAMQINSMADKLFEYFLVYSAEEDQTPVERLDINQLMSTIWSEYITTLETDGFQVYADFAPLYGQVSADTDLLHRVFDNLYSNLTKYADHEVPIQILCMVKEEYLSITIKNGIVQAKRRTQSTNIGLKTCKRIVEMHLGSFSCQQEEDLFCVHITLPLTAD